MIPVLLVFSDWALLFLRLVVATIFLAHGWPKLKNLKTTQANFGMMGFKPGWLWGTIVGVLEPVSGALLILGLATQIIGLLLAIQMAVAAIWNKRQGRSFIEGYELDLLLVTASLVLATSGAGALSLESYLRL